MGKRVFRPFNTWGIVVLGFIITAVLTYSVAVL